MIEFCRFMKILHIVGARPQFVKATMVSRAWNAPESEFLLHTGQHYSKKMSPLFFDELKLRRPDVNLGIGGGNHAEQTGKMLQGIDEYIEKIKPDHIVIYGDTNSTLAGALAASKRRIPLSHVEAGLRSYNRSMPEEINRLVSDHVSNILFCPTKQAVDNLADEGISENAYLVGDVMADALFFFIKIAEVQSNILYSLDLLPKSYALATVHRSGNVDDKDNLSQIIKGLQNIDKPIILPLHPRTKKMLGEFGLSFSHNVRVISPIGYLDMLLLEKNAECILTDSGGVQKEAYLFGVRCITMRDETEWTETVAAGWNILSGMNAEKISRNYYDFHPAESRPAVYGSGDAADKIVQIIKLSD
ncbi:MAG: UDP-N-acetylglucosamine 2-epimerase (non-hydrolyzing) [Anaerolineaceae bacterium]|nr:UDP-N-acetylglucosamine 2-epimerase (non-hydrolyzing) [Anaerolineaceae bacterium]